MDEWKSAQAIFLEQHEAGSTLLCSLNSFHDCGVNNEKVFFAYSCFILVKEDFLSSLSWLLLYVRLFKYSNEIFDESQTFCK